MITLRPHQQRIVDIMKKNNDKVTDSQALRYTKDGKHRKMKMRLIGQGENKSDGGGPYTEDPDMERSKYAPPLGEGKNKKKLKIRVKIRPKSDDLDEKKKKKKKKKKKSRRKSRRPPYRGVGYGGYYPFHSVYDSGGDAGGGDGGGGGE